MEKHKKAKKAQISIEILLVVGFILALFLPLIAVSQFKANEIRANSDLQRELFLIKQIATAADIVGTREGSALTLSIYIPETVESISVVQNPTGSFLILEDSYSNQFTAFSNAQVELDPALEQEIANGRRGYITLIVEKEGESVVIRER